jgi:hypothetical protein
LRSSGVSDDPPLCFQAIQDERTQLSCTMGMLLNDASTHFVALGMPATRWVTELGSNIVVVRPPRSSTICCNSQSPLVMREVHTQKRDIGRHPERERICHSSNSKHQGQGAESSRVARTSDAFFSLHITELSSFCNSVQP